MWVHTFRAGCWCGWLVRLWFLDSMAVSLSRLSGMCLCSGYRHAVTSATNSCLVQQVTRGVRRCQKGSIRMLLNHPLHLLYELAKAR